MDELENMGHVDGLVSAQNGAIHAILSFESLEVKRLVSAMAESLAGKKPSKSRTAAIKDLKKCLPIFDREFIHFELLCPITSSGVATITPDTESPRAKKRIAKMIEQCSKQK